MEIAENVKKEDYFAELRTGVGYEALCYLRDFLEDYIRSHVKFYDGINHERDKRITSVMANFSRLDRELRFAADELRNGRGIRVSELDELKEAA